MSQPIGIDVTGNILARVDGAVAYTFTHDQWGLLGRVVVSGHGARHIKYGVHPAPDSLSHPNYQGNYSCLKPWRKNWSKSCRPGTDAAA